MKSQYFKLKKAHQPWLLAEVAKGNIYYDERAGQAGVSGRSLVGCGPYRADGFSFDALPVQQIERMMHKSGCVYWRNEL